MKVQPLEFMREGNSQLFEERRTRMLAGFDELDLLQELAAGDLKGETINPKHQQMAQWALGIIESAQSMVVKAAEKGVAGKPGETYTLINMRMLSERIDDVKIPGEKRTYSDIVMPEGFEEQQHPCEDPD